MYYTFSDAIEHLADYLGGGLGDVVLRDARRSVYEAHRELANAYNWSYLYTLGRINTVPPFVDGTVQFQLSSGAYPRLFTLTTTDGGVWPPWTAFGFLRIGTVNYQVDQRISNTQLTVTAAMSPTADISVATPYSLYQDSYPLPVDYISQDQALYEMNFGGMQYTHPREWAYENRYIFAQGIPSCYTIMNRQNLPGRMFLMMYPLPTDYKSVDFIYKRRPRALNIQSYSTGTVSTTFNTMDVIGVGTTFTSSMVGSVLRVSNGSSVPTSYAGKNPPYYESVIVSWVSSTHVVVADPAPATLSGVAYVISDPIDYEIGSTQSAFLRCCEKVISVGRTLKDKPSARLEYIKALNEARAADSRSFAGRHEGQLLKYHQRLRDMPIGPDQP